MAWYRRATIHYLDQFFFDGSLCRYMASLDQNEFEFNFRFLDWSYDFNKTFQAYFFHLLVAAN